MNRRSRLARLVVAELQETIARITQKYPGINPRVLATMGSEVPEQSLEWIVGSMAKGSGKWPEDKARFLSAWQNFQTMQGNQKFKQALTQLNSNTRNPLNFTLDQIESAQLSTQTPSQSKRQEIKEVKRKGARLIADRDGIRCYEVTTPEAVCFYARGSKWCTSSPGGAEDYLATGPLYVFVDEDGDKLAQFTLKDPQFKDELNEGMPYETIEQYAQILPQPLKKEVLVALASYKVTVAIAEGTPVLPQPLPVLQHMLKQTDKSILISYASKVLKGRWPEAEKEILASPNHASQYAVAYATRVIGGRWPEAEPVILKDTSGAVEYVEKVLHQRWPEAEKVILEDTPWHIAAGVIPTYAEKVIGGRWTAAEPILLKPQKSPMLFDYSVGQLVRYAKRVIRGRWSEAEPIILHNPQSSAAKEYLDFIK